jgi:hypothetical protein
MKKKHQRGFVALTFEETNFFKGEKISFRISFLYRNM